MTTRAVSNPVGVILILGMTVLSVGALVAVGGAVIDDTRADAERSQMENSMSAFSSKASLVGLGESGHQRFSLGRVSQGRVDVREDAGRVRIWVENGTSDDADEGGDDDDVETTEIANTTMGAVVYENDGREIAYQGGGVWARQDDFSRMLSPPEFHYRAETLTFPIINVTGDGAASGDVRGTVSSDEEAQQLYPNNDLANPLANGTVYVEIESEYCQGWQSFFETRSQGQVMNRCESDETVIIELAVPFSFSADKAIMGSEITINGGNEGLPDGWSEDVSAPPIDSEVENRIIVSKEDTWDPLDGQDTVSEGKYTVPENYDLKDTEFSTDGGDIILISENDITFRDITISGDNNVTVYTKGDVTWQIKDADWEPFQLQIMAHSNADIKFNGNSDFEGIMYAPDSNIEMKGLPSESYGGAIVGKKINARGGGRLPDYNPNPSIDNYQIDTGDHPLTYLHVSENQVKINFD